MAGRQACVGRDDDLAALRALVEQGARVITILGPAGIGKTTLARAFTERERERYDAMWFCQAGEARDAIALTGALARDLDAELDGSEVLADALAELGRHIDARLGSDGEPEALLVLDNLEQVGEDAATVVAGLARPRVTVLVTSRQRLRLRDEQALDLAALAPGDAADLFIMRAAAVRRDYTAEGERREVLALCEELDRIPLAIELAAARMRVLSVPQLRQRLAARFELLTSSPVGGPARHATLREAIAWSWELLTEHERRALMQCAVFEGGFSSESAEAVLRLPEGAPPILDVIEALRDQSLLRLDDEGPVLRFALYHSIRAFARQELQRANLVDEAVARHADHYLGQALRAAVRAEGRAGDRARHFLLAERDNLLAIHRRSVGTHPERALRAAVVLQPILIASGPAALRLRLLEEALGSLPDRPAGGLSLLRGWAWLARGDTLLGLGRLDDAANELARAAEAATAHGDDRLHARALWRRGTLAFVGGRLDESERHVTEALAAFERVDDGIHIGRCLGSLGLIQQCRGQLEEAGALHARALAHHQDRGDRRWVGTTTLRQGEIADARGDLDAAERSYTAALRSLRQGHHRRHEAQALIALGALVGERGEPHRALDLLTEALSLLARVPDARTEATCLLELGELLGRTGDLLGACAHLDRAGAKAAHLGNRQLEARSRARLVPVRLALDDVSGADDLVTSGEATDHEPELAALWTIAAGHLAHHRADRPAVAAAVQTTAPLAERSAVVRRARLDLLRALDDEPPDDQLVIAEGGDWLKPPGGERVDLAHRTTLRNVLGALLVARFEGEGAPLDAEAIFAAGWPGERAKAEAATSRVYVALSTLRKLGLGPALIKDDDGYRLDPNTPIIRWS